MDCCYFLLFSHYSEFDGAGKLSCSRAMAPEAYPKSAVGAVACPQNNTYSLKCPYGLYQNCLLFNRLPTAYLAYALQEPKEIILCVIRPYLKLSFHLFTSNFVLLSYSFVLLWLLQLKSFDWDCSNALPTVWEKKNDGKHKKPIREQFEYLRFVINQEFWYYCVLCA